MLERVLYAIGGLAVVVALMVGYVYGQRLWVERGDGHATIDQASIASGPRGADLDLTVVFNEVPPGGDPTDVELVAHSEAIGPDQAWGWAQLAELDEDPSTTPESGPPLGSPVRLRLALPLLSNVRSHVTPDLELSLRWAGERQHGKLLSLAHIYGL